MTASDSDDYVYDEATGEWVAPGDLTVAASEDEAVEVRDSAGT
ncbi:MAG: PhnA protein, partial [Sphingopyxis sp.]